MVISNPEMREQYIATATLLSSFGNTIEETEEFGWICYDPLSNTTREQIIESAQETDHAKAQTMWENMQGFHLVQKPKSYKGMSENEFFKTLWDELMQNLESGTVSFFDGEDY